MASSCVVFPRFHRIMAWKEFPCCVRMLRHDSGVFSNLVFAAAVPCRPVHCSSGLSGKNYLHKFSKNKKRVWFDSTWSFPMENNPPSLQKLMKQKPTEKKENVRIRALNVVLYDALTGLLSTSEVSDEIYDFSIELSKVSVSDDFSVCRAYWLSSGNKETDNEIEKALQKYAPRFRHLMISHHVLGNVPPVVFVRDKADAKRREIEDLFEMLKSGEEMLKYGEDNVSSVEVDVSRKLDTETSSFQLPSIFGIDHADLNQQILAYKKKVKDKVIGIDIIEQSQQQQEQLAAIRKKALQRKKMKKKKESHDMSPQEYLLASAMDSDKQEELDFDLYEDLVEMDKKEESDDGSAQT